MGESSYPAALYLAVHSSDDALLSFYRKVCAGASRVLELGCGAGRIACALAAEGRAVVGVDVRADLIALAPPCGARFVVGDIQRLDLRYGRRKLIFDRVIAPYHTLYCMLSETALVNSLRRIRRHMTQDGLLVFDGWAADDFHAHGDPDAPDDFEPVARVEVAGQTYEVLERSDWNRPRQRIDAHYRHVPRDGGAVIEARIRQRYLCSKQVPRVLARAGLALVALLGDFDGEPFHAQSEHLIVIAQPRAP
jgi:SAM-dependent methyltransferase